MRLWNWIAGLSLVFVLMGGVQALGDSAVLTIDPAKLTAEQLGPDGWGEPTKVDDRACRVISSGKDCWLRAAAWWKEGLRPAEGQYFLAEIVYKDAASKPVQFNVWAGLGSNESRTELHRFGGLADGKWKTAQVPLGWDMVMVRPGTRSVEFSIESKGGDVPVASIRVLPLAGKDVSKAAEQ